jgi:general stress protein 26
VNERQKIYEMLDRFESAMLVTHNPDGMLDARPMRVAEVEPAGRLWFMTSRSSRKVGEIAKDARVLLVYQDGGECLSIAGTAHIVDDTMRTRRLWKDSYKIWFPKGVDDPDLVLLSVEPEVAEFWDVGGLNGLRYLFDAAKAYVTGERAAIEDSDKHARLRV